MHLALARKYRPQNFLEVVGQDTVIKTIRNAIENNRLHHAYLFSGVRGVGKTSLARILAKSINCEKGPTISPCQQCAACRAITEANSLDVVEIDGASNNLVEDVRELREQVKFLPAGSRYKIIIIDEVHMLSNSAFNALLKTLEEPPAHVIFIFATTEPHEIPITILSRCQKYDFRKVNTAVLVSHLAALSQKEGVVITQGALHLLAQCAQGSVRDGVSLLDQVVGFKQGEITEDDVRAVVGLGDRLLVQDMFSAIIKDDLVASLACLNQVDAKGVDLKLFAEGVLACFRHQILLESTGSLPAELSPSEQDFFKALKGNLDLSLLLAGYQVLFAGLTDLVHTDFQKSVFEVTLVKLNQVKQMIPLVELVDDLMSRGGGGGNARTQELKNSRAHDLTPAHRSLDEGGNAPTQELTSARQVDRPSSRELVSPPNPALGAATSPLATDWYQLVKWITTEKPPLGGMLKDVVPVLFSADRIEVAAMPGTQLANLLSERSGVLSEMIDRHFGKKMAFVVSDLDDQKKKPPA